MPHIKFRHAPLALALLLAAPVWAQSTSTDTSSSRATSSSKASLAKEDQKMLQDLAQANMAEVKAGEMALSKSQNPEVKKFAQKMVDDHTKGMKEVQQLATSKGVTLTDDLDTRHKAMVAAMDKLSGDKFDRTYMSQGGVSDHKKTHKLVQDIQAKAKDPDLKALGAKLQPVIDQHLQMAEGMKDQKADRSTGASGSGKTQSGK